MSWQFTYETASHWPSATLKKYLTTTRFYKETSMFKFVFPALMCVTLCCTTVSAQDCCEPTPTCCAPTPVCKKTRKRLALVDVQREVCRSKVVCGVDECGCPKKKVIKVKECVTRKKLALVDVEADPCKKSCISKLRDRMDAAKAKLKALCDRPDPCCPAPTPCCN